MIKNAYFRSLVNASGQFFIEEIQDEMQKGSLGKSKESSSPAGFSILQSKISPAHFKEWMARQDKAMREFESIASFDEKSKAEAELQTVVLLRGHVMTRNDNPRLKTLEQVLGAIVNI